jgi:hypothetical protein
VKGACATCTKQHGKNNTKFKKCERDDFNFGSSLTSLTTWIEAAPFIGRNNMISHLTSIYGQKKKNRSIAVSC